MYSKLNITFTFNSFVFVVFHDNERSKYIQKVKLSKADKAFVMKNYYEAEKLYKEQYSKEKIYKKRLSRCKANVLVTLPPPSI